MELIHITRILGHQDNLKSCMYENSSNGISGETNRKKSNIAIAILGKNKNLTALILS